MMHEFYQCREVAKITWDLLRREPKLVVVPLGCMLPTILMLLLWVFGGSEDWVWEAELITAVFLTIGRIATAHGVFASLRGTRWTPIEALLEGAQHWQAGIILGVIDATASLLVGLLVIYALFGSLVAAFWCSLAALIPCAIASGYSMFPRAVIRAERVFSLIRTELMLASFLLAIALSPVVSFLESLGLLHGMGGVLFIILILEPVREIFWQVYVSVAYFHNAPAPY